MLLKDDLETAAVVRSRVWATSAAFPSRSDSTAKFVKKSCVKEVILCHMKSLRLIFLALMALPHSAEATVAMPHDSIAVIAAALPQCSGGWIELGGRGRVGPNDLTPSLFLLSRPSDGLNERAGRDLYQIAKGLLVPSTGVPDWVSDGSPSLKCAAHPKEAVALLEYLVGEGPETWRGHTNAFQWLGLAYEKGVAGTPNQTKARRYYLRFRMHAGYSRNSNWSDGIDADLIGNAERSGLRPYLDALAQSNRGGGAARVALAEAELPTDPLAAQRLLLYVDDRPLGRLLELESDKRVPVVNDAQAIAVWAEATRKLFGYKKYAARMLDAVRHANGGTIPTSAQRPTIGLLRPYLDKERVADADPTRDPIPVRALVDPDGRAIFIEACQASPAQSMPIRNFNVQLDAARLYNVNDVGKLPKLPTAKIAGRLVYSWVILPAVHFLRSADGKQEIRFVELPAGECVNSAIANAPLPPVAL